MFLKPSGVSKEIRRKMCAVCFRSTVEKSLAKLFICLFVFSCVLGFVCPFLQVPEAIWRRMRCFPAQWVPIGARTGGRPGERRVVAGLSRDPGTAGAGFGGRAASRGLGRGDPSTRSSVGREGEGERCGHPGPALWQENPKGNPNLSGKADTN